MARSPRRSRETLTETMRIDPADHAAVTSHGRWQSFLFALAGVLYALRHQRNTWVMGCATVVMVAGGIWLGVSSVEWAVLILAAGLVWVAEFLNSAIEAAVDVASPALHPMAKVAKDVAAGAVLTASYVALVVAVIILGPALADRF
jgi:diacylglycerol kinase